MVTISKIEEEEKGLRAQDIDRSQRTPQQLANLKEKIKSQTPKIKYLKEITEPFKDEATIVLKEGLPLKDKVRNRGDWISERRKIADRNNVRRIRG